MRKLLWDISGAFGDIGIFFPLAILLISKNGINPTAMFLAAGIFYVVSAFYFRITMPVQPLKAMCVIAISMGLGFEVINAAGILMGIILIAIAATGISEKLGNIFPLSVIRGIQLGLGAMLVKTSFNFIFNDIAIACVVGFFLFVVFTQYKSIPPLIPIMILGVAISLSKISLSFTGHIDFTPSLPNIDNFVTGFTILVIPQIALTFGNSIVATRNTGILLYGDKATRLNLISIPLSIGLANILSGFFGGAPMCHGSGGLTAHYNFGAKDSMSGYIIGITFISIALFLGNSSFAFISAFPVGILGIILFCVGIQHASYIKDIIDDNKAFFNALIVGIFGFVLNNLTIGFLAGLTLHYGLVVIKKLWDQLVRVTDMY
ncbi:MAG: putative sulfate/molybdate transporter [Spirochaetota bacterium]